MKDEIKEILDNFKNYEERYKQCNENQFIIFYRDIHLLLDYITNLQEKYNKALELLVDYDIPCELNDFNIHESDYCQNHCTTDDDQFKKCWDKYIECEIKRK